MGSVVTDDRPGPALRAQEVPREEVVQVLGGRLPLHWYHNPVFRVVALAREYFCSGFPDAGQGEEVDGPALSWD